MNRALNSFLARFKAELPRLTEAILSWPSPQQSVSYPFCVLLKQSTFIQKFLADDLKTFNPETGKAIYQTGVYNMTLNLHYFYKTADDLAAAEDALAKLFNPQNPDNLGNNSFQIQYGTEAHEIAVFRYISDSLASGQSGLRKGENRTIFAIEGEVGQFIEKSRKPMRLELDPHISENPRSST